MSWVFYACWNWRLLPLLVGGALLDFGVARRLGALEGSRQGYRRLLLGISLAWNLGALAFFKYVGFFAESFNLMLSAVGLHASVPVLHVLLPLGISFYTLQRLGYVFDVYLGRYPPCRSLLDFLLFAGYFRSSPPAPSHAATSCCRSWPSRAGSFLSGSRRRLRRCSWATCSRPGSRIP
ncbi:MAG: hypothetical protein U1F35_15230 [Steroidobacteraceae bacterium]